MNTHVEQPRQRYSLLIEWSDRDQAYVISFPEWEQAGHIVHTHGATYGEAVEKGQEMLAFLVESALEEGVALPEPHAFAGV